VARRDAETLAALGPRLDVERLPPIRVVRLARQLGSIAGLPHEVELLRRAQPYHAGDFWINHWLGVGLFHLPRPDVEGATRYLMAAVALRPESAGAWVNLGNALRESGPPEGEARAGLDSAIAAFREAIRRQPDYAAAHFNLGLALREQKGR
jgi:tetratricopeptide (TPR) repeat protein